MAVALMLVIVGVGPFLMNDLLSKPIQRPAPQQVVPQEGPRPGMNQQARL
jgi:hypothetical protein